MITIEVMTRKDCCLCDDAKKVIEQVISEMPAELKMTDIESDPELLERYEISIPVLKRADNQQELFWPFGQQDLAVFLGDVG